MGNDYSLAETIRIRPVSAGNMENDYTRPPLSMMGEWEGGQAARVVFYGDAALGNERLK